MKVFIHSSSKDIDIVQDLAHRLEAAGVETHWANESAKSDKTISVANRALREADEIFVILTNESVDDPNLMVALGAAYSTRRHVTPIVVGLQTSQIPSPIKSLKYIKYPDLNAISPIWRREQERPSSSDPSREFQLPLITR